MVSQLIYALCRLTNRVFGRRYRQVVRGWEASIKGPDRHADRRCVFSYPFDRELELTSSTNWSGAAMATFYTAVRQALVVAIIIRGLATVSGVAGLGWYIWKFAGSGREL